MEKEELPVEIPSISVLKTDGLTSTRQLIDTTANETFSFSFKDTSSDTAESVMISPGWQQAIDILRDESYSMTINQIRSRKRNEILRQAIDHLQHFRESLGTPEAAMHIHLAKKKLEESREFTTEEDHEVRLALSAVEGAIRQQKWRNYKSHQIAALQAALQECIDGKLHGLKDVLKITSKLRKQDIDIFPSAPKWAYEEDDETESDLVP